MKLQELANLILVRNHLNAVYQGLGGGINKENSKQVGLKISQMDEKIIQGAVELDLENLSEKPVIQVNCSSGLHVKSTELDTKQWQELIAQKVLIPEPAMDEGKVAEEPKVEEPVKATAKRGTRVTRNTNP